jgi:hypothetical protein
MLCFICVSLYAKEASFVTAAIRNIENCLLKIKAPLSGSFYTQKNGLFLISHVFNKINIKVDKI